MTKKMLKPELILPPTAIPWNIWMLRYIASDDEAAFNDLVISVGGSPPYGNVSYEEATTVYHLLELYLGPGMAPEDAYEAVHQYIKNNPDRLDTLEVFKIYERITSSPEDFTIHDITQGLEIAERLEHVGVKVYFLTLQAQLAYNSGDIAEAKQLSLRALPEYLQLSHKDKVYHNRAAAAVQNTISCCAMEADFETARQLLYQMGSLLTEQAYQELHILLGNKPKFNSDLSQVSNRASQLLEVGNYPAALEWYTEAECLARETENESALCGLLGDKAFAFNRLGNTRRAIETYQDAIAFSEIHQDWENLSRWSQNLGLIYLRQKARNEAKIHLKKALDAALASGLPYQISTAVGNYACVLEQLKRYEEASQAIDRAMTVLPDDPELNAMWCNEKFIIYDNWATQLSQEGQISNAIEKYDMALQFADLQDAEQLERAAVINTQKAALYEQQNNIPKVLSTIDQAVELFQKLDDDEVIAKLEDTRTKLSSGQPRVLPIGEIPGDIDVLRQTISQAEIDSDLNTEATARIQLCSLLLQQDNPEVVNALDETLALVRRMQDRRRELILCLNFAPYFLGREELPRALNLAERAVSLAGDDQVEQKILANLYLGQVWSHGFNEPGGAMQAYRKAIEELRHYLKSNPQDAKAFLNRIHHLLAEVAQSALDIEEVVEAGEIIALIDPHASEELRPLHKKDQATVTEIDISELQSMSDSDLDLVLTAWRASATPGSVVSKQSLNPILQRMAEFANIIGWTDAANRLVVPHTVIVKSDASQNGPAGLLHLAKMVANHEFSLNTAQEAAQALTLSNDDLACISLFVEQDNTLASSGVSFSVWQLASAITTSSTLKSRLYKILGMFSFSNPESQLEYYHQGASCLASGEDDPLRAELLNEAAVTLTRLNRFEQALEVATQAKQLAESIGATQTAAMAEGNRGLCLMNLRRWEEAIAVLKPLTDLQRAIGDEEGLSITRDNLNACYMNAGYKFLVTLDEETNDPVNLFNLAGYLSLQGDYERAIELFNRGLKLIEGIEPPYEHEAGTRHNFARTLYSARRTEEAIEQMKMAAKLYEEQKDVRGLHDAYAWLTAISLYNPATRKYYAERALELGRQLNDPEELSADLGHLGQIRTAEGQYSQALPLLQEAVNLVDRPEFKAALADALAGTDRIKEALILYNQLMLEATQRDDIQAQIRLLLGQAEALQRLSRNSEALSLLRQAYRLPETPGLDRSKVHTANRLGLALLEADLLEEAAQVLENGIDQARALNLPDLELSLLSNLGNVLKEMGDLDGAKQTLQYVRDQNRALGLLRSEVIALATLGNLAVNQDRYEEALSSYLEAADIAREAGERDIEAACLDSIGTTYSYLGQSGRAIEYHKRASQLHQELKLRDHQAVDLINLTEAYLALDEIEQATETFKQVTNVIAEYNITRSSSAVALIEGRIAAITNDWTTARKCFHTAINELEKIRSTFKTPSQQRQWAANKAKAYYIATEAAIKAGDGGTALEFIEANKARFLNALIHRRTQRPIGVDETTWLRYQQAADRRSELQAQRWASLTEEDPELEQRLNEATAAYLQSRAAVELLDNSIIDDSTLRELPNWDEMVQTIPPGYVVVSLSVYPTGLGIVTAGHDDTGSPWAKASMVDTFTLADLDFLIFGDHIQLRQAITEGQVDQFPPEKVGWLLGSWAYGQSEISLDAMDRVYGAEVRAASDLWPATIAAVCQVLGQRVWPSIMENIPKNTKKLILMPSFGFALLPLHASILDDGTFIDRHFQISYTPSLSILKYTIQKKTVQQPLRLAQVTNPTQDLPFSAVEAHEVAKSFTGAEMISLSGPQATISRILPLLDKSDILHFCGHAFYDQEEPFRSGLVCVSESGEPEILTLGTILEKLTTITTQLVVLSACETGQVEANDFLNDFLGLPGGFIVTGARNVLASLWRVDDLATSLLLSKFFELWNSGRQDCSVALANAQYWLRNLTAKEIAKYFEGELTKPDILSPTLAINMRRYLNNLEDGEQPFREPYYWAAFYIIG